MWGGGVWGSAAFDPAPEAVPAPAPYPDGTYAMTPSQFDAQVESWTAKQADFDASLRRPSFRATDATARDSSRRSRGVRGPAPTHERVQRPHGAPCRAARGPRGARARAARRVRPVGGRTGDGRGSRVGGRDVSRCRCQSRGSGALGASSRDDAAGRGGGGRAGHRLRGVRARRIRDASRGDFSRRKRSRLERKKRNRAARDFGGRARDAGARLAGPPSSRASPTGQPRALISASGSPDLRGRHEDEAAPPAASASAADAARRLFNDETSSSPDGAAPVAGHGQAPARGVVAREREAARGERGGERGAHAGGGAPRARPPGSATCCAPSRAKSPFLAEASREARAHARAIRCAARGAGAAGRHGEPELYQALRDRAEAVLAEITDEPRVLRLLEFPEARLESLRASRRPTPPPFASARAPSR